MNRPKHGLQDPAESLPDPLRQAVATVGAVGEHDSQSAEGTEFVEHEGGSVIVLPVSPMNNDRPDQPQRVHGQVALPPGDFFSRVVAAFVTSFRVAVLWAVDDRHAGGRLLGAVLSNSAAQSFMDALPDTGLPPAPENRIHGFPLRKIMRERTPLAAGSIDIKNRIEDQSS